MIRMKIKLIILITAFILISLSFVSFTYVKAQMPAQPAIPAAIPSSPYILPNPGSDPWSQFSWHSDYCNKTGMDFLVLLDPTACSPAVVRSDLLEEQDVPVMCRLTGVKINPLIQVPYIKNIVVGVENKSREIAFVNFWPARTALTYSYTPWAKPEIKDFEGVPTMNNLGYLWVQLARQPVEAKMPDNITANLNAIITYDVARTYGVNEHQFGLPLLSQEEWLSRYKEFSFWRGKGYVRLLNITGKSSALLGVYTNPRYAPQTVEVREGQISKEISLPGFYCGAGASIRLDKISVPEDRARLLVNGNEELLGENEQILDSDCRIAEIEPSPSYGGKVRIWCHGKSETLTIEDFGATIQIEDFKEDANNRTEREKRVIAGDRILLTGKGREKNHSFYVGWIGKQLAPEEKLIGKMILFSRGDGKPVSEKVVRKIVSVIHSYMKTRRGEALTILEKLSESQIHRVLQQELKNLNVPGAEKYEFYVRAKGFGKDVIGCHFKVIEIEGPEQASYSEEIEAAYKKARDQWEAIAHEYSMKPGPEGMWYGVMALRRAADLARDMHKRVDQAELLKTLINRYAGSEEPEILEEVEWAREELRRAVAGAGNRFVTLERPSGSYSIELLAIEKKGFAEYTLLEIEEEGAKEIGRYMEEDIVDGWEITGIEENSIMFRNIENTTKTLTISKGSWSRLDGTKVRVIDIIRRLEAKVTILPFEKERRTEANFTVRIGIEKRAIKLSPAQTRDVIAKLEKTIAKLEGIRQKLNTTIGWWKKACFVGASALWIKNFITGLTGEALARKLVMESWGEKCANPAYRKLLIREKDIKAHDISISRCYKEYETEINEDVELMKNAIRDANNFVKKVKEKPDVMKKGGFFGLSRIVDEDKFIEEAEEELKKEILVVDEYKELYRLTKDEKDRLASTEIEIINAQGREEKRTVEEVLANSELLKLNRKALVKTGESLDSNKNVVAKFSLLYNKGWLVKDDVKEIYLDIALYKECQKQEFKSALCSSILKSTYEELLTYSKYATREQELSEARTLFEEIGIKFYIPSVSLAAKTVPAEIFILNRTKTKWLPKFFDDSTGGFLEKLEKDHINEHAAFINPEGILMLVILEPRAENYYRIVKYIPIERKDKGKYVERDILEKPEKELSPEDKVLKKLIEEKIIPEIREVQEADPALYESPILRGLEPGEPWNTIKFWDKGPYEGKVAYMPIEKKSGWYFATKSYTGLEGALVAYKETGDVNAVWICNVGPDGAPNFDFVRGNVGDDYCVEIIRETLLTLEILNPTVRAAYDKALGCAQEAMIQYAKGEKLISTRNCGKFKLGKAPIVRSTMQCEDFMSPSDCRIMYNLCDPVMCPASRCDFGGRMPVENVIQSGIIGSIMLCWPNFEGGKGILVPVCLTGVHAGLDSFVAVLKSGRDCLEEQLKTGKTVGICDQMMSLYICEFFWRQFDPFIRAGLPAITESLISRGGGEYALFSESWKQSLDAANYFTEFYATETFKAFKARSTAEIGSEICKKFVGIAYPTQAKFWEELARPESPAQAFATFQEIPLGGPSTDSHYKVYFHIFAGRDQGAYYSIWLRKPPARGLVPSLPEFIVPRGMGYLAAGQYISQTPDFKAPSGYKEICIRINEQEFCGFQQAGTNFALEQMQNYYLEDQVRKDVKTAKECVSGKPTIFPSTAIVTNIQSAVEKAMDPQIYRRGIVRVCATGNPGRGTPDEELWKVVGYCDDKEVGCWIYQKSLNESISDLGIRAEIYNYTDQQHLELALEELNLSTREESNSQLNEKEKQLRDLGKKVKKDLTDLRIKIEEERWTKEKYYEEIGYSEIEEEQGKIWLKLKTLASEFKAIKRRCAHPDEKVRADWAIAELLNLQAKLISLAEIVEVEKRLKEEEKIPEIPEIPELPTPIGLFNKWPVESFYITSCFGWRTKRGLPHRHRGIDIRASRGTDVKAVGSGRIEKVLKSCREGDIKCGAGYGNFILIKHNERLYTRYSHLSSILVNEGSEVKAGQIIGKTGNTGDSTDPHLDFRVHNVDLVSTSHPICFFNDEIRKQIDFSGGMADAKKYKENEEIGYCVPTREYCEKAMLESGLEIIEQLRKECHPGYKWLGPTTEQCHALDNCFLKRRMGLIRHCYSCAEARECSDFDEDSKKCEDTDCLEIADAGKGLSCKWEAGRCVKKPEKPEEKPKPKEVEEEEIKEIGEEIKEIEEEIEEVEEKELSNEELAAIKAAYQNHVPVAVNKFISEKRRFNGEGSELAIAILKDFFENYELEGKELEIYLYRDSEAVSIYDPKISELTTLNFLDNTVGVDKANIGDMLLYYRPDLADFRTVVIDRRKEIIKDQYVYRLIEAGRGGWKTEIKVIGEANENPGAGIDYNRYIEYFTKEGTLGKHLLRKLGEEGKPRRWDFKKILKVKIE